MSAHNPEFQPPPPRPANEAIEPGAPDFVEMPEAAPAADEREPLPAWLYLVCGFALFMAGSSFTGFGIFGMGLYDQGPGGPSLSTSTAQVAAAPADPMALGKKF